MPQRPIGSALLFIWLACLPAPSQLARPVHADASRAPGRAEQSPSPSPVFAVAGEAPSAAAFDPDPPGSAPAAPVPGEEVAIRGADQAIWLRGWDGHAWTGWWSLGGQSVSQPAVASWGPGRLDLFAAAVDGALWHRWWEGAWHPWEWLGGSLAAGSTPAAAATGRGQLDVFVRGVDHGLWRRSFSDGQWRAWERIGCCISSDPAAACAEPGTVDVFVHRMSGGLWDIRLEAGAPAARWHYLGGQLASVIQPAAASAGHGRLDVFVRGLAGDLWHRSQEGGQWRPWEELGCCMDSTPSVAVWGNGRFDLFGRGADDQLWKRRFNGAWEDWEKLDGRLAAAPAATSWAATENVISDVPYHPQVYALSCEAASIQMALAHQGIEVSQGQVIGEIGIDWRGARYQDGELRWGDPYTSFVGDPDGDEYELTGYGTYFPTIARVAAAHGATVIGAGEGIAAEDVYRAVLRNHPVVAWVTVDLLFYPSGSWRTFEGREVLYAGPVEHAVTVVGVDDDSVYLFDPLSGPQWVSKSVFETAYKTFNRMAVILE